MDKIVPARVADHAIDWIDYIKGNENPLLDRSTGFIAVSHAYTSLATCRDMLLVELGQKVGDVPSGTVARRPGEGLQ